jgi:pilus assembly protein Flp/PilA
LQLKQLFSARSINAGQDLLFTNFGHTDAYRSLAAASYSPVLLKNEIQETATTMITFALNALARLHNDESGQVEYLLVLALVALAATAGMSSLASTINSVFTQIGIDLGKYIGT